VTATPNPWDRYLDDRRSERIADEIDAAEAYERHLDDIAADRRRLWLKTPVGCCGDCLKPIPPGWSTCIQCDAQFDEERRRDER
jgi:hypothetical protein